MQSSSSALKSWRFSGENLSLLANEALADDNVENKTEKARLPSMRLVDTIVIVWHLALN